MPFRFERLEISDIYLIEARVFNDHRGFFLETYKHSDFVTHGIPQSFNQDNYSHSIRGVLRGLHYQMQPKAQGKLVKVLRGEIFDVAVDIRKGSPTYGQFVGITLSAKDHQLLYIPVGFAHGFCVVSDEADVVYKATNEFAPELDRGIAWNDPELSISWPVKAPILSEKDVQLPLLGEAENNFVYKELRA